MARQSCTNTCPQGDALIDNLIVWQWQLIEVAKGVLQVHRVDERRQVVVRKHVKRSKVLEYFANMEPCLVGMQACAARATGCGG